MVSVVRMDDGLKRPAPGICLEAGRILTLIILECHHHFVGQAYVVRRHRNPIPFEPLCKRQFFFIQGYPES